MADLKVGTTYVTATRIGKSVPLSRIRLCILETADTSKAASSFRRL
jgi:hypothetical protein